MYQFFSLLIILISFVITLQAQSPAAFQYQAVARDNAGLPIANQNISIRISILTGSPSGSIAYVETHAPTTNQFGLFSLAIGTGTVSNGTFAGLNWGNNAHFVKVEMDETGGMAYQDMGTTQLISVPYALHAASADNTDDADADPQNELQSLSINGSDLTISNGNTISIPSSPDQTLSINGQDLSISNGNTVTIPSSPDQTLSINGQNLSISNGNTIVLPSGSGGSLDDAYDFGGAGAGKVITADAGEVEINTSTASGIALRLRNTNTGAGLVSETTNAGNGFSAIQASTNSTATGAAAIVGNTTGSAYPVAGQVASTSTAESGIYGSNLRTNGGHGVLGIGFNGVVGQTGQSTGFAVYGENFDNIAPLGNGIGVAGKGYYGVIGEDRYLGTIAGANGVFSNGNLAATGTKTFQIDHPMDPQNKFLRHFSIESDEVLNVYRGNISFDQNGEALVTLPDYFALVNKNYSYQLTPVGAFMQLYVKEKINDQNQFVIAGGLPGKEVSWAVYAERNDLYLQKYPQQRTVELEKRAHEKGKYLMPQLYNEDPEQSLLKMKKPQEQTILNIKD